MHDYEPRHEKNCVFCKCENKGEDQQCIGFSYIDSTVPLLNSKFQASSHFRGCTVLFVLDLVGNSLTARLTAIKVKAVKRRASDEHPLMIGPKACATSVNNFELSASLYSKT